MIVVLFVLLLVLKICGATFSWWWLCMPIAIFWGVFLIQVIIFTYMELKRIWRIK